MDLNTITVANFKARFPRDFEYVVVTDPDYISDQDIENAFSDAQYQLNQGLFGTDPNITLAYLYLTAHCMCLNLRAAGGGGINSTGGFPVQSRSVGSVSESYAIPREYTDDPLLAQYTQTSYGMKYLTMALPAMRGNMAGVYGGTNP